MLVRRFARNFVLGQKWAKRWTGNFGRKMKQSLIYDKSNRVSRMFVQHRTDFDTKVAWSKFVGSLKKWQVCIHLTLPKKSMWRPHQLFLSINRLDGISSNYFLIQGRIYCVPRVARAALRRNKKQKDVCYPVKKKNEFAIAKVLPPQWRIRPWFTLSLSIHRFYYSINLKLKSYRIYKSKRFNRLRIRIRLCAHLRRCDKRDDWDDTINEALCFLLLIFFFRLNRI